MCQLSKCLYANVITKTSLKVYPNLLPKKGALIALILPES